LTPTQVGTPTTTATASGTRTAGAPTPTRTPSASATATSTRTATPSRAVPSPTATRTSTPTATPTSNAVINLGSAGGMPGDTVTITATLVDGKQQFAATSNDIVYDATQISIALNADGKPDCTINADIGADSALGKILSTSQPLSPPMMRLLRVQVLSSATPTAIPDGLLFTCNFAINLGASAGVQVLSNMARASDAASILSTLAGTDGTITVSPLPPTATATATPTATPTSNAVINLSSASGVPGDVVAITATLVNGTQQFAATSNDIVYDATQVSVALRADGKPDCVINADIGVDSALGKTLTTSQPLSPAMMKLLRVGVLSTATATAIPDGLLFTCNFVINLGVPAGVKVLSNTARASDPASNSSTLTGTDGTITVSPPPPTATATATPTKTPTSNAAINLSSASGVPGDIVTIAATLVDGTQQFAATSNDIIYDATQVRVALNADGKPDCTINAAIGASTAVGKTLSTNQPSSPPMMKLLRVAVLSSATATAIPDGLLFTCNFTINLGVPAGVKVLSNTARASDPASNSSPLTGTDGMITVSPPPPTATATGSSTPTSTATGTDTPTATSTSTVPAQTPTATPAETNTSTPTNAPTSTQTDTLTPTPTFTAALTPTATQAPPSTLTPTPTPPDTATPTVTLTEPPTPTPTTTFTKAATPTPTGTMTATPVLTPTPTPNSCVGDCGGSSQVTIGDIITMVNIALENAPVSACAAGDRNQDGEITVDEILAAVSNALDGCAMMAIR